MLLNNRIIAIAGVSASGKSSLAKALEELISGEYPNISVGVLEGDSYYKDQAHMSLDQRRQINYDHPDAIDQPLFLEHIRLLRAGNSVDAPKYNYHLHTRSKQTRRVSPASILIVPSTLILTQNDFLPLLDYSIFTDTPLKICLARRIERDCNTRGRTAEFVKEQFQRDVIPMYYQFVSPSRNHASLIVSGEKEISALANQVLNTLIFHKVLV